MSNYSILWSDSFSRNLIPNITLSVLEILFGIFGNGLVLLVYAFRMKSFEDRYFIPLLAAMDLFASVISNSFYIINTLHWVNFPWKVLCKMFYYLCTLSAGGSGHTLLIISLQRYLMVCQPIGRQMTRFWKRVSVAMVIIIPCAYSSPTLYFSCSHEISSVFEGQNVTGIMCSITADGDIAAFYYFSGILLITVVNIIAAMTMYIRIGLVMYKKFSRTKYKNDISGPGESQQNTKETENTGTQMGLESRSPNENKMETKQRRDKKAKTRFNFMFFTITTVYMLSYFPTIAMIFVAKDDDFWLQLSGVELVFYVFLARTYTFNFILNPVIYGYFDTKFRTEVRNIFRKL